MLSKRARYVFKALNDAGHDAWFVGGCVRDHIMGIEPKDIDICTTATPEEQISAYKAAKIKYFLTGISHGTITARSYGASFEVTTLRTEINHDGRRAEVKYSKSLEEDLKRRDFTMNAIAMTYDGNIIDPLFGAPDAKAGILKFVGDPIQRIQEDYLRILRYFRFYKRIDNCVVYGNDISAIKNNAEGLKNISAERIWSEMSRILAGSGVKETLTFMNNTNVLSNIGYNIDMAVVRDYYDDRLPAEFIIGTHFNDHNQAEAVARAWKMSNAEKRMVVFACKENGRSLSLDEAIYMIRIKGVNPELVLALDVWTNAGANYDAIEEQSKINLKCPVSGNDILELFEDPREIAPALAKIRDKWALSGYKASKEELLDSYAVS